MRILLLLMASCALAGCENNDASNNRTNTEENLTAENIVSNDVTAIDAVTGDASNMANDVDLNYGNIDENGASQLSGEPNTAKMPPLKSPRKGTSSEAPRRTNANQL